MADAPPIPWRYNLGAWLASHRFFGTARHGHWFMAWEIARMTKRLSHVERNTLLRKVTAEVVANLEAYAKQSGRVR